MLAATLSDQALGQVSALPIRKHPAHDVAAIDVQDHIEIVMLASERSFQVGDVPTPDMIGRTGLQLGLVIDRMPTLSAPLPDRFVLGQKPVHRAKGAQIDVFFEQLSVHLAGRGVHKALREQQFQELGPFRLRKGAGASHTSDLERDCLGRLGQKRLALPIEASATETDCLTRSPDPDLDARLLDQSYSTGSVLKGISSKAATFFWRSSKSRSFWFSASRAAIRRAAR